MKYCFVFLTVLILVAGCEKDIQVKVPELQPQLTIYSYTEVGGMITASIGRSIGILHYNGDQNLFINNAIVLLYVDGVLADTLILNSTIGDYKSHTIAQYGKAYRLVATATGYSPAEASCDVPALVPVQDPIEHVPFARYDVDNGDEDKITIKFNDPAGSDYYLIHFFAARETDSLAGWGGGSGCIFSNDNSVETPTSDAIGFNTCIDSKSIFLKDQTFNGKTKELSLYVGHYDMLPITNMLGDTLYPAVKLYHITEEYFRYLKSYKFSTQNEGNPFAEPTNIYGNVKNGYGIFTIAVRDYKKINN